MLLKIGAIAALVIIGFTVGGHAPAQSTSLLEKPFSFDLLKSIGAAMVPIAFAYGGWQTATFVAAEIRDPRRDLSRGLLLGVSGVVVLYLAVNLACLRVLGPAGLDTTTIPASDLMEWIEGLTLAQAVSRGALDIDTTLAITQVLLRTVAKCHEANIHHRDLKPDNVVLRDGDLRAPVIVDFGMSWAKPDGEDGRKFETDAGQELGNRFLRLPEHAAAWNCETSAQTFRWLWGCYSSC